MADTHHSAAERNQRRCGKAEFFCAQHSSDRNISAVHQLAVCFDDNMISQTVQDQRLVCFRKTQFPRQTCVVDRAFGRSACSAVMTGDQDDPCACFGNACRYRSDARFRYELDRDTGAFVGVFEVVDQL